MSFRFLKKKDGSKVLQQRNMATLEYEDVPTVEEKQTATDELVEALAMMQEKFGNKFHNMFILVSENFYHRLEMEMHTPRTFLSLSLGNQYMLFYGFKVHKTNQPEDFKFAKEI
jgi:hypothetical protein